MHQHPLKPMLAELTRAPGAGADDPFPTRADTIYEPKMDGMRAIVVKQGDHVFMYSRAGNIWAKSFPEVLEAVRQLPIRDVVLDGEMVVLRDGKPNFHDMQNRGALSKERRATDLQFYAFDILQLDDIDTTAHTYRVRREALVALIGEGRPNLQTVVSSPDGQAMWNVVEELELEGLIGKPINSTYRFDERGTWKKYKRLTTSEFVVVGYQDGVGARAGGISVLVIAEFKDDKLVPCGLVGTGFSHAGSAELLDQLRPIVTDQQDPRLTRTLKDRGMIWVRPDLRVLVQYPDRGSGGVLKMASYQGMV